MDPALHEIANRFMNQAVAGDGVLAGEGSRSDGQAEVAAFLGPGMAGMAMRFILDIEARRLQGRQALSQQIQSSSVIDQVGNTLRKGLTSTLR